MTSRVGGRLKNDSTLDESRSGLANQMHGWRGRGKGGGVWGGWQRVRMIDVAAEWHLSTLQQQHGYVMRCDVLQDACQQ